MLRPAAHKQGGERRVIFVGHLTGITPLLFSSPLLSAPPLSLSVSSRLLPLSSVSISRAYLAPECLLPTHLLLSCPATSPACSRAVGVGEVGRHRGQQVGQHQKGVGGRPAKNRPFLRETAWAAGGMEQGTEGEQGWEGRGGEGSVGQREDGRGEDRLTSFAPVA